MLSAVKRQGLIYHIEEIESECITLKVLGDDKSRVNITHELNAKSGLRAVLLLADELADTVGDLVVSAYAGNVNSLGNKVEMTEGDVLSIHRELTVSVVDVKELNAAHVGIIESGALKRAAVAVHRATLLSEVGLLMMRSECVVVRAKAIHLLAGYGAVGRANVTVKICISAYDVDLGAVVYVLVKDRTCSKLLTLERPAVYRDLVLLEVEAGECI